MNDRPAKPGEYNIIEKELQDDGEYEIYVERQDGSDGTVTVKWGAMDESGTSVRDGTLTFGDGETGKYIKVPATTKKVVLTYPTGGSKIDPESEEKLLEDIPDKGASGSAAPAPEDLKANATTDIVTVVNVPAGATVKVYAADGVTELGTATNGGSEVASVPVPIVALTVGTELKVSITEVGKSESEKISVTAVQETTAAPLTNDIQANATTNEVTVANVPAGATVKVYAEDGVTVIGTATNNGGTTGQVTVTLNVDLVNGDKVKVTVKEANKNESTPVTAAATQEPSTAPSANDVQANATTNEVTVANVPAGATVRVYAADGETVIGTATNNGGTTGPVTVTLNTDLVNGDKVKVTITEANKNESTQVTVTATQEPSTVPSANDIQANATTNEVTVANVPAGATVKLYAEDGVTVIGTATNTGGTSGPVTVTLNSDLANGDEVKVTITETNKNESASVTATATQEPSTAPSANDIQANATTNEVMVANVPAGATVKVYAEDGVTVLGTATNTGGTSGPVTVTLSTDLVNGDEVKVTVKETNKNESASVTATAKQDPSTAPSANDIQANATTNEVTVANVPAGATVKVYAVDGLTVIGTAANTGGTPGPVTVTLNTDLANGDEAKVTITEANKNESASVTVTAVQESSTAPSANDVQANATTNEVMVANVPAGATVKVYAEDGVTVIGTATNNGATTGQVTVTLNTDLANGDKVKVTVKEVNKNESTPVMVTAVQEPSTAPSANDVQANATTNEVTVANVPAGATVKVYAADGETVIGTATNTGGTSGPVTLNVDLANGDEVKVAITEANKNESTPVTVTATQESSTAPSANDIQANATTNEVTVANVPAGATVKVYAVDGLTVIGTAANTGGTPGPVTVTLNTDLANGDEAKVTITEANKNESASVTVTAVQESSTAPSANDIQANATTNEVTVANVPAGATVKVYAADGETVIGTATNNGGTTGPVTVTLNVDLANGDEVKVTVKEANKNESTPATVTAVQEPSTAPSANDVQANATTNEVTVANVPAGATVKVYAEDGVTALGTATNTGGTAGPVIVTLSTDLANNDLLKVTLAFPDKNESVPVDIIAFQEKSVWPAGAFVKANATTDQVSVHNIPVGWIVSVYGLNGLPALGTAVQTGGAQDTVTVSVYGLRKYDVIRVTVTQNEKDESDPVEAIATQDQSAAPTADQVRASSSLKQVFVNRVPGGTIASVYDAETMQLLGSNANAESSESMVTVTMAVYEVPSGAKLHVTMTETEKDESNPLTVFADMDPSPDVRREQVTIHPERNEIVVKQVPAGATIVVYDENGNEIYRETNNGMEATDLTVGGFTPAITPGKRVGIAAIHKDYSPSTTLSLTVPLQLGTITADALNGTVTVRDVPAGTTVTVYYAEGRKIGEAENNGTNSGPVVVKLQGNLNDGDILHVTTRAVNGLESDPIEVKASVTDDQALNEAARQLRIEYTEGDTWESVTSSVFLATVGAYNTNVAWTSSKPDVVTIPQTGDSTITTSVHRQAKNESVILTAVLTKNGKQKIRTFLLVIKPVGGTKQEDTGYTRNVEVKDQTDAATSVPVTRINVVYADNSTSKIDKVVLTPDRAAAVVANAGATGNVSTIVIDELPGDEADEVAVELPTTSVEMLADNAFALNVETVYGTISLDAAELSKLNASGTDLFFRLVPIKQETEQEQIRNAVPQQYQMLGRTLEVETNYSGYETKLMIPFLKNGIDPSRIVLNRVKVYIEHSDGEKVIQQGTVVYNANGTPVGIEVTIHKFSTFTIVQDQTTEPTPAPGPKTETVEAAVESGSNSAKISVIRTEKPDGSKKDELTLTRTHAEEAMQRAVDAGMKEVLISIPDKNDHVSETNVTVPLDAAQRLGEANVQLIVDAAGVRAKLPEATLRHAKQDILLRFLPVKDQSKQDEVWERTVANEEVSERANGLVVQRIGRTIRLETNLNQPMTVVVPLADDMTESVIKQLAVFIESNGSAALATGRFVDLGNDRFGIEVEVTGSASFTLIQFAASGKTSSHSAYIQGYPDGEFKPGREVTRAEMAALFARNLGGKGYTFMPGASFYDVSADHWAAQAIEVVKAAGLMIGGPDGNFRPDEMVTRAEMAQMSARLKSMKYESSKRTSDNFADVGEHWAAGAIDAVQTAGVMKGYEDGDFRPNRSLTRAEAVTAINRLFERGPLFGVVTPTWADVPTSHWAFRDIEEASGNHSFTLRPEGGEQKVE
ncbi:S-layer homology domain-containing protein [Paenibacillus antri]|nr:S-layer homology domain-containing protein [Paenibacillus antri]